MDIVDTGAGKDQAVLMSLKRAFQNWDHVERTNAWGWNPEAVPMCSGWHGVTCNAQVALCVCFICDTHCIDHRAARQQVCALYPTSHLHTFIPVASLALQTM